LNAVDSEHQKNRQQDGWRLFQLGKSLSVDGHKWRKFGSGNRESLLMSAKIIRHDNGPIKCSDSKNSIIEDDSRSEEADGGPTGREVRRRLMEWWRKEYCAGRMKLAVVGKGAS
jgi:insulysin